MKHMVAALALLAMGVPAAAGVTVQGAGASFPFPIYAQWAYAYNKATGVRINYQSMGSSAGIAQIKAGTVDFGASDAPMDAKDLQEAGLVQFPMVIGGVVPIVNLGGIKPGQLKLGDSVLADIFMGKVTKWNDPAIKKDNPDVELPDKEITVVSRADGSGTTWIYTTYLAEVSAAFKDMVGAGTSVKWPVGVTAKGNEGVAAYVKRLDGTIGYVEYAYSLQNKLPHAQLRNKAGTFVDPNTETFMAAAANADWKAKAPAFDVVLVNQPGEQSWPIAGASFILVREKMKNPQVVKAMLSFFNWAYESGGEMARKLDYVPVPDNVVKIIEDVWADKLSADGQKVWPVK